MSEQHAAYDTGGEQETDAALLRRLRGIIESASLDRLYYESSPDEMRRLCDLAEQAEQAEARLAEALAVLEAWHEIDEAAFYCLQCGMAECEEHESQLDAVRSQRDQIIALSIATPTTEEGHG